MKGDYAQQKNEARNIFSKLHHRHSHRNQPQLQTLPFSNTFPLSAVRECQTSEEDDASRSSGQPAAGIMEPKLHPELSSGDGATLEVVRRPRGRPPGSKNKPKPPVIITRDSEPAMSPYILEVPEGNDVVEVISYFSRRKNMGLCILSGSGTVANVSLRQPSSTPGPIITFHGRFEILSISATFFPQTMSFTVPHGFTISLAGPQGQIIGGLVAGSLVSVGTVFVIAASFNNPSYHRLSDEDEVRNSFSGGEVQSPPVSGGGESGGHAPVESCVMPVYSCHVPSDVIWASAARQATAPPPPHPHPHPPF